MNDYKKLIKMLRSMSKAIIREDAKLLDVPEDNIWDADADAINDAANAIEQFTKNCLISDGETDKQTRQLIYEPIIVNHTQKG